ncbi:MAG: D-amino acid dehydrogenase [Gammaproteobacteria bacterium]
MKSTVAVVGAGLMGTTTAWFLAQHGFDVTVIERRDAAGLETSFANGGLLTPSESDPWNAPGTLRHLLGWMGHEDSPLLLRVRAIPGMLGWGIRFLRASKPAPHARATDAILRLALYNLKVLGELEHQLPLKYDRLCNGTLKVFHERKAFEQTQKLADRLRPLGLESKALTPHEAAELEPWLQHAATQLAGAIHYPQDGSGDAYEFTRVMQEQALAAGVKFRFGTMVTGLHSDGKRLASIVTSDGIIEADLYVVAAGSYSPLLVKSLHLALPIYPAKGYSVTLGPVIGAQLRTPIVDFEQKVVITPLGKRLRIAGTAEFNGYNTQPNPQRSASALRQAAHLLPEVAKVAENGEGMTYWAGLRPMTCDGPPILGASGYKNLFFNTGHGPLGWTLCAGSARLVADIVAERKPEIDVAPYRVARFSA